MADYNRVKIGTVYLTDDGTDTGMPCRVEVAGLDRLKAVKTGAMAVSADGTPYAFVTDNQGKGATLSIKPFAVRKAVFDDVVDVVNAALTAGTVVNVTFTDGDVGDFDVDCLPVLPNPVTFPGTFSSGIIDGVEIRFAVTEVN